MLNQEGTLQVTGIGLFLVEMLSIVVAIGKIVIYWRYPRLVLNQEFFGDERARNVGPRDGLTAVERYHVRRWEAYRAQYPDFEQLPIEDVTI